MRPGERWGAYEILRLLGQGSFADVWLARHVHLRSRHAIKHLDPRWAAHPGLRERFLAEGRILAQLRHPAIVPVTDLLDDGPDHLGLVMEFVEGESLAARVEREGPLAPAEAVAIVRALAEGLHHAHEAGVIHRDVKPANVVLVPSDGGVRPVLLDFGVAKIVEEATVEGRPGPGTRATTRLGTPQYMSPEQVEASHAVDRRTDVFSLGSVLYELLTGRPAFEGSTVTEILFHVTRGVRRPLAGLPDALVATVDRAMEVLPERRYPTARAFADALAALPPLPRIAPGTGPVPSAARVVERVATQATLSPPRRGWGWPLVGAAALAVAGLGALAVALAPAEPVGEAPSAPEPPAPVAASPAPSPPAPLVDPAPPPAPAVASEAPAPRPSTPRPSPSPPPPAVLDAAALDRGWQAQSPALRACAPPGAARSVWKIAVGVDVAGAVTSVQAGATRPDAQVSACLEAKVRAFTFGPLGEPRRRTFSLPLP